MFLILKFLSHLWVIEFMEILRHRHRKQTYGYIRGGERKDKLEVWDYYIHTTVKNLPAIQETWIWSLGWEDPLEKGMATHSRILAWRVPWTEEPAGLQSMGWQRVEQDWMTKHTAHKAFINNTAMLVRPECLAALKGRRRRWHPTPILLPGESHRQRSLVDYSLWDCKSWTWLSD